MRLLFSHHAFVRMGDWHPEYAGSVSERETLGAPQIEGIMRILRTFLSELGRGRPSTLTERLVEKKAEKYRHRQNAYLFDRQTGNFYQMVKDERGLVVVTVTWLNKQERVKVLDEPKPLVHIEEVTEISLPYLLKVDSTQAIDTPWAKQIPLIFGIQPRGGKATQDARNAQGKLNDQDFRTAVAEVYRQYLDAGDLWAREEWGNKGETEEKYREIVNAAHAKMMTAEARVLALLGTATGLYPTREAAPSIPELLEAAAKRRKK